MPNYTITYDDDDQVKGWPSFYSYYPDWMQGMNNFFYTFKGGNLYRHNSRAQERNTFYLDWHLRNATDAYTPSKIISVFNDIPLQNKLFKTLNIEGDDAWDAEMYTDIQLSGKIDYDWFEKKEQSWYGFIRNEGTTPASPAEHALRSLNGIGNSTTVSIVGSETTVHFDNAIDLGSIISINDDMYFFSGAYLSWAGKVSEVNVDKRRDINNIVIDTSMGGTVPVPSGIESFAYIKNSISESHGLLGHYCVFELTNSSTVKIELFAAESEIMKSYP